MTALSFRARLGGLLLAGMAARVGYVLAQPAHDPTWSRPILDGAYYLDWARALVSGEGGPQGAYYLAPLYPVLLAGFLRLFGESFQALYLLQQAAVVAAAGILAGAIRVRAGEAAGLSAAALALLYHPFVFFASRPVGEALALLLLAGALRVVESEARLSGGVAGLLAGLAGLARPNLLVVPGAWAFAAGRARRRRHALLLLAGVALAVLPATVRNAVVSGHWVPVSSNAGVTLYHGNGPGATGIYTPAQGLSGALSRQREEATALARAASGRDLDPVEADRWWGRQALRARIEDPLGTLRLAGLRLLLLLDSYEHGLDDPPSLDGNPWRRAAPVPFGILLGLAGCGLALLGPRRTGGLAVWSAIAACAVAPLVFYASSRYRLAFALVLCAPAGAGLAALMQAAARRTAPGRIVPAAGLGVALALVSWLAPSGVLARSTEAAALSNLAVVRKDLGELTAAETLARQAVERDPSSSHARFTLGAILEARGRAGEAEAAYREALALDPGQADAAGNLAHILIERGAPAEAISVLRRALASRPAHEVCWTNLVVALAASRDLEAARTAAAEAEGRGVRLDPGLLDAIGAPERTP